MESLIVIVHVLAAVGITGLVLIQQGKGADAGASFGGGASQTMFGSVGSGNVLTKSTSWLAVVFFATSLGLAVLARQQASQGVESSSLIENMDQVRQAQQLKSANDDLPQVPGSAADDDLPQVPAEAAAAIDQVQEQFDNFVEGNAAEAEAAAESAVDAASEEAAQQ